MTLSELLAPFGVTDEDYLTELAASLGSAPVGGAAGLSTHERSILDRFSGVAVPSGWTDNETGRAWLRNSANHIASELRESFSAEHVATMLGIAPSRVRHRVVEHSLYGFKVANRLRLPSWQFESGSPIPGLRPLLVALPDDLHPLEVAGFVANPDTDLEVEGQDLCPRDWLLSGGDPEAVARLARTLGTIW